MTAAKHTLVRDGWPHYNHPKSPKPLAFAHVDRAEPGRAACTCRWTSEWLTTTEARRQAHAQHVTAGGP